MKIRPHGGLTRLFAAFTLALLLSHCARGPGQLMTIVAPASPGGGWDQTARAMQQVLRGTGLVPSAQVVNVPGAGGMIGLAQLINSNRGDGDILMTTGLIMLGAVLTNQSPVTLEQATPIARLLGECEALVVPATSPIRTLPEFLAAWRADTAGVVIAGGSAGGADHIAVGLLALKAGVAPRQINYLPHSGGGESIAAILGGHVAAGISGYAELAPFIRSGQMRVLGLSSAERLPGRDHPTFVEQGVDLVLTNWRGVVAAPGVSVERRAELGGLVEKMCGSPEWKAILEANDWIDLYLPGAEFESFLHAENARVTEVLRSIGLVS